MTNRFQMTVSFGSGEDGARWASLVEKLCKRFNADPTEVVRIAVRTLNQVKKEDAILDDKQG